jgi:hypothetical protein
MFIWKKRATRTFFFGSPVKSMGEFLAQAWGDEYVPFGLYSYQTDINWPMTEYAPRCSSLPPSTAPDFVEVRLHKLNVPYLIADLQSMKSSTSFFAPNVAYEYGPLDNVGKSKIDLQFNGLIYLEHSPAMDSLVWGNCNPGSPGFVAEKPFLDQAQNVDFSQCTANASEIPGWFFSTSNFSDQCTPSSRQPGRWSVLLKSPGGKDGAFIQCMPTQGFVGTIHFSGDLRLQNIANGFVELWMNLTDGNGNTLATVNPQQPLTGTTDWTTQNLTLNIPANGQEICFGIGFNGTGSALVENLKLTQ